jgi:hypothetical protein
VLRYGSRLPILAFSRAVSRALLDSIAKIRITALPSSASLAPLLDLATPFVPFVLTAPLHQLDHPHVGRHAPQGRGATMLRNVYRVTVASSTLLLALLLHLRVGYARKTMLR